MCEPASLLLMSQIAGGMGAVMSVAGQVQQGQQQKEMYNAQAQQSLNDAAYKSDAATAQAEKIRKAGKAQQGEANASLAASGVKLGEGTALEVRKTIATNVEEDALSALLSGKRATSSAQQEAQLLGKAGDNAVRNTVLGAAGTAMQAGWKMVAAANKPAGGGLV